MTGRKIRAIVILVVVSLAGLTVLQFWLLGYAFDLKEQSFRRNVLSALNIASKQLETNEILFYLTASNAGACDSTGAVWTGRDVNVSVDSACGDSIAVMVDARSGKGEVGAGDSSLFYDVQYPQRIAIEVFDPVVMEQAKVLDSFYLPGRHRFDFDDSLMQGKKMIYRFRTDSASYLVHGVQGGDSVEIEEVSSDSTRVRVVRQVLDRLAGAETKPLSARVDTANLDSVVASSLSEAGVHLDFISGIVSPADDSLLYTSTGGYDSQLRESSLRARLFSYDLFAPRHDLVLFFPGRTAYLWRQVGPLFLAAAGLMLVVIACFAYAVRALVRQRRLSLHMKDFINNMTHEFRTPISTIALSTEAIMRSDVSSDKGRVLRFNDMIRSETQRMRKQTDKILQLAALEEGDYELIFAEVDIHDIIKKAVKGISLHVESRDGDIQCQLTATRTVVSADSMHLTNVVNNLLDNANKYSPANPAIRVSTADENDFIGVTVSDRGVGISARDLSMVWDKYFRVPAGNIHDVKGFGLGLSYVRMMVTAHGGSVSIKSEPGQGTAVKILLPIVSGESGND
ncbi:MAG: HAMP domain-containing histidine kinase [Candidatus Zixiibacteriota bacterium]|nr:MAG: HAMP domain-containing histidine kinase [candidate division Zixibacteria bacterium]